MSCVAPVHRLILRGVALSASFLALALFIAPGAAEAAERRVKGAHGKRHHVISKRDHGPRIPYASGRRTDLYGYGKPRHHRDARPHHHSGQLLASGRRTEGVYGWRGDGHRWRGGEYGNWAGWRGPGIYRVRDHVARSQMREDAKWLRAFDRPYDGYQNGRGYFWDYGSNRVSGYGPGFGGPLIIPVGPGGGTASAADPTTLEGGCAIGEYCVVRLGPFTSSPKIITLNSTGAAVGDDSAGQVPPVSEPEVYELEVPEGEPVK